MSAASIPSIAQQGAQPNMEEWSNATVIAYEELNEYTGTFHVKPDSGRISDFRPGQFTTLGLPKTDAEGKIEMREKPGKAPVPVMIRRAYSIGSSPERTDAMEFFIVRVDEGELTPRLWKLCSGGRIWMADKIAGEFTLDHVPPGKKLVFVSTGTGIAPFIAMIRFYEQKKFWDKCVLINGCRLFKDVGYLPELRALEQRDPNFKFFPMITREPEGVQFDGLRGRCQVAMEPDYFLKLAGFPLDPADCCVFLCGNPQMIDQCETGLIARGFKTHKKKDPGNLHFERYW